MSTRTRERADFEEFVVVCGGRLRRTARLLALDEAGAETLLRDALARAYLSWSHLEDPPEPAVRQLMVTAHLARRPRRRAPATSGSSPGVLTAFGRLTRRQRAVVVLHHVEGLDPVETAEELGCSVARVRADLARAAARLGFDPAVLAPVPGADTMTGAGTGAGLGAGREGDGGPRALLRSVGDRVEVLAARRRARRVVGSGVLAAAALTALVAVPSLPGSGPQPPVLPVDPITPEHRQLEPAPPRLCGFPLASRLVVNEVPYNYLRSEQTATGTRLLRVAVPRAEQPVALAWATPRGTGGTVRVSVDGETVVDERAGRLRAGITLSAGRPHLVVVRATGAEPGTRVGLAMYGYPAR